MFGRRTRPLARFRLGGFVRLALVVHEHELLAADPALAAEQVGDAAGAQELTWRKDIAPIVKKGCAECHGDRSKAVGAGAHAHVSCEVCHAPLSTHVAEGKRSAAMAVAGSGMMVQVTRSKYGIFGPAVKLSTPPAGRGT